MAVLSVGDNIYCYALGKTTRLCSGASRTLTVSRYQITSEKINSIVLIRSTLFLGCFLETAIKKNFSISIRVTLFRYVLYAEPSNG